MKVTFEISEIGRKSDDLDHTNAAIQTGFEILYSGSTWPYFTTENNSEISLIVSVSTSQSSFENPNSKKVLFAPFPGSQRIVRLEGCHLKLEIWPRKDSKFPLFFLFIPSKIAIEFSFCKM